MKFTDEGLHQQAIAAAKSKFKIWPSAYASGWMTRHYRQLYKAKKGRSGGVFTGRSDSLKEWFAEDWKAINSSGKIVGGCGDGATKGKVKCLPDSKARSLSKKDRSTIAKRKQKQDPKPNREGAPVMVSSKKREDSMTPEVFAQAILSIEQNYGLRLDARSTWLRLDEFKKVKELAGGKCNEKTGWYGLKGACKRGKKGEGEARSKESKVEIAGKIRTRKMNESSAKKAKSKPPSQPVEEIKAPAKSSASGIDIDGLKRGDVLDIKATKKTPPIPYEYHSSVNGVMKFIGRDDRSQFTTLEKSDIKDLEGYGLIASGTKRKEKDKKDKENGFTPNLTTFSAVGDNDVLAYSNSGLVKNKGEIYDYMGRDKENNLILMGTKGSDGGVRIMTNKELMEQLKSKQVKINT